MPVGSQSPERSPVALEEQDAVALLLHDGELADVRAALDSIGTRFVERVGAATREDLRKAWRLIVTTPHRALDLQAGTAFAETVRVAVLEKDSRTLRAMMRRMGIDLMLRRPFHPAALRLLLLHTLYQGPERRKAPRISIGALVHVRIGFRRRQPAILAELSCTGCRLVASKPIEPGRHLNLRFPADLGGGGSFSLRGRVRRIEQTENTDAERHAMTVVFGEPSDRVTRRLNAVMATFEEGPAALGDELAPAASPLCSDLPKSERRTDLRRAYEQRVIATGEDATRALIGRDISVGGMRVHHNRSLSVGDKLEIALHAGPGGDPLVVKSVVERDDRRAGHVLRFHDLSDSDARILEQMLGFLPILQADGDDGILVSEILEHTST